MRSVFTSVRKEQADFCNGWLSSSYGLFDKFVGRLTHFFDVDLILLVSFEVFCSSECREPSHSKSQKMKNQFLIQLVFPLIGLLTLSCSNSKETTSRDNSYEYILEEPGSATSSMLMDNDVVGTWSTTVNTRRGKRQNSLIISLENDILTGKTENDEFVIKKNGSELTWKSQIDSPMGKLNATYSVIVTGDKFRGYVSASGRKINLEGVKMK